MGLGDRTMYLCYFAFLSITLFGCSSIETHVGPTKGDVDASPNANAARPPSIGDGLVYYMPMRPFKITVTVDKDKKDVQSAQVAAGDTIPDLQRPFLLQYRQNYFGTNHAVLAVNSKGLLQSSNAGTTSGVSKLAEELGTLAGDVGGFVGMSAQPPSSNGASTCQAGQTYVKLVYPEDLRTKIRLCNFTISGSLVTVGHSAPKLSDSGRLLTGTQQSGIFYRHDLPYLLIITDTKNNVSSEYLAYSPDQSEISFVPSTSTFFASSQTNITLSDGIATGVDETSDGELVALTELPADVLSAYFKAVGGIFTAFGQNTESQTSLTSDKQKLAAARVQYQVCKAALAANDPRGKTGDDLKSALANIAVACP